MFKSFVSFLCATALASAVVAQNVIIEQPTANTNVVAGSNITVQLSQPNQLTGYEEVAVVIGTFPCTDGCPGPANVLGDILYNGPYDPQYNTQTYNPTGTPYQNFTITIPAQYSGPVQLGVAHFYLLGAGLYPVLQVTNTTVNVVSG